MTHSSPANASREAIFEKAIRAVIDASGAYLPPDGISKDEFINRVLGATDNSEVFHALNIRAQQMRMPVELAAWLCALEDAECHKPIPESLVERGRRYIHAGMTEKHCGDCTNECHSCVVCGTEGYLLHARQIIKALALTSPGCRDLTADELSDLRADAVKTSQTMKAAILPQRVPNDELRWPVGCHSPESCGRNRKCMYVRCRYDGNAIPALTRPKLCPTEKIEDGQP